MKPMTVDEVAAAVGLPPVGAGRGGGSMVTSVEFDSRKVVPGTLFLALAGENVDGHRFAAAAAAAGAVAVLGTDDIASWGDGPVLPVLKVPDPLAALAGLATVSARALIDDGLRVIGVTGSAGKTSTKDLIAAVAAAAGETIFPPESFNNELGHPYTVLRATADTKYLVLELSARGVGHIAMLTTVAPPSIGVVLNVGTAHLGEFGSVDAIATAKGELVESLPAGAEGGVAILNADDGRVAAMSGRTAARVVTYGIAANADVRAVDIGEDDRARARFTLCTLAGDADVQLAVAGRHQVGNALAAAAVGIELGLSPSRIAEVLTATGPASRVADGGHRPTGRCDRRQRRLQRQPGLDEGRVAGAGDDRPRPPDLGGARGDGRAGGEEPRSARRDRPSGRPAQRGPVARRGAGGPPPAPRSPSGRVLGWRVRARPGCGHRDGDPDGGVGAW